jgi:trigger factor
VPRGLGVRVPSPAHFLTLFNSVREGFYLIFLFYNNMATVVRESLGELHEKLTVTVSKEDYLPNFEKALKQYGKQANIPGFRKGMVPTGMIKKMYGEGVFQEEVLKTLDTKLGEFIETEKIDFFAQPLPMQEAAPDIKMTNPQDYSFSFELGLRPSFNVADLKAGNFTKYKIQVTDETVNKEIESMQKRASSLENAEAIQLADDNITVQVKEEGAEGEAKEFGIPVSYFKEDFRNTNVIGKKANDAVTFNLETAFDTTEQNYIKKELGIDKLDESTDAKSFSATIVNIKTPVVAELNEAFFEQVYPGKDIKTTDAFKAEVAKDIEAYYEGVAKGSISDQVYKYWLDNTPMPLPETFLKNWMQKGQEKPITAEQAEKDYPNFSKSLQWTLISNELAKANEIKVDVEDIKRYAKNQLFSYYGGSMGMDEDAPWVQDFANKMTQDKKFVNEAAERIVQEKIFDWAESQVNTTEENISLEAFEALRNKQ